MFHEFQELSFEIHRKRLPLTVEYPARPPVNHRKGGETVHPPVKALSQLAGTPLKFHVAPKLSTAYALLESIMADAATATNADIFTLFMFFMFCPPVEQVIRLREDSRAPRLAIICRAGGRDAGLTEAPLTHETNGPLRPGADNAWRTLEGLWRPRGDYCARSEVRNAAAGCGSGLGIRNPSSRLARS
jgi:hypothetical protein